MISAPVENLSRPPTEYSGPTLNVFIFAFLRNYAYLRAQQETENHLYSHSDFLCSSARMDR